MDGLNLAAHNLRHGLLGADEPNFPRIFLARKAAWVYKHWADKVGFTENNVGGSNTPSLLTLSMLTGTSANNIASLYSNDSYYLATASAGNSLGFNIFFYPNSAAWTSSLVYLGMFVTPTAPTDTQAHFGIKCLNGDVFTSIGNGSVGTQDDTGLNLAQYGVLNILGFAQQNEIKIYINNTLYKTATTNLPNDVGLYLLLYLKTTNTTQKAILVMPIQLKRWLNNEV